MNRYLAEAKEFRRLANIEGGNHSIEELTRVIQNFLRFPFENASKIISCHKTDDATLWPRKPDKVLCENISFGAGGTCFSLTFFLQCIISEMGYDAYPILCDRSYGRNTHSALIVSFKKEKLLIDPGFLLGKPFILPKNGSSTGEKVELTRLADTAQYTLLTRGKKGMKLRYRFIDKEISNDDFQKAWNNSFSWPMMRNLSIGKATTSGMKFVMEKINSKPTDNGKLPIQKLISEFGINANLIEEAISCLRR